MQTPSKQGLCISVSLHDYQINVLRFDAVLSKHLSYQSFDTISLHCSRKYPFACNNSKLGILFAIAHKEDVVKFVSKLFGMYDMIESVCAK